MTETEQNEKPSRKETLKTKAIGALIAALLASGGGNAYLGVNWHDALALSANLLQAAHIYAEACQGGQAGDEHIR